MLGALIGWLAHLVAGGALPARPGTSAAGQDPRDPPPVRLDPDHVAARPHRHGRPVRIVARITSGHGDAVLEPGPVLRRRQARWRGQGRRAVRHRLGGREPVRARARSSSQSPTRLATGRARFRDPAEPLEVGAIRRRSRACSSSRTVLDREGPAGQQPDGGGFHACSRTACRRSSTSPSPTRPRRPTRC